MPRFRRNRIGVDRLFVKTGGRLPSQGSYVLRFDYGAAGKATAITARFGFDSMLDQTRIAIDYIADLWTTWTAPHRPARPQGLGGAVAIAHPSGQAGKRLVLWSRSAIRSNDIVRIVGRSGYDEAVNTGRTDYADIRCARLFDSLMQHQPFQSDAAFRRDVLLGSTERATSLSADYSFLYRKVLRRAAKGCAIQSIIFQLTTRILPPASAGAIPA
ncbi:alpha/beta hydrolase [Paenibacillus thailandensis]|uniref:alpha/beta hydrolase n=1 Tax=Paenibacillus thailandensis TaxID=393250 RepID=UPI0036447B00